MNWKCILFGHTYDVKLDNKTIICSREKKILAIAKKGCAWELASLISNKRWRVLQHILILGIVIFIAFTLLVK